MDIYLDADSVEQAFFKGFDLADAIADRISFLSYAPASWEVVSTTVPSARYGEVFPIALPIASFRRSRGLVTASQLEDLDRELPDRLSIALRTFRTGLAAAHPYKAFVDLWVAVEILGTETANREGMMTERKCDNCDAVVSSQPAAQQVIRELFREARSADKTEAEALAAADEGRKLRGTLLHGGLLENEGLRERATSQLAWLQSAAAVGLVKELELKPVMDRCEHVGFPLIVLNAVRKEPGGEIELKEHSFKVGAGISFLPPDYGEAGPYKLQIGVFYPIPLEEFSLPDLTR